jgi:hypothetical protein
MDLHPNDLLLPEPVGVEELGCQLYAALAPASGVLRAQREAVRPVLDLELAEAGSPQRREPVTEPGGDRFTAVVDTGIDAECARHDEHDVLVISIYRARPLPAIRRLEKRTKSLLVRNGRHDPGAVPRSIGSGDRKVTNAIGE